MSRTLKWFLVLLLIVLVGAGGFIAGKFYWQKANEPENAVVSKKAASPSATKSSEYAGCWQTYKNVLVGYTLKYPCDWTLKEVAEHSETINADVKHITITTPDAKYFVYFGVRKNGVASFEISDRTGVGAGDFQQKPNEAVSIFGVSVTPKVLVYQGKIKEYFFDQPQGSTDLAGCDFGAGFSYDQNVDYNSLDMTNLAYIATVKLILKSAALL